MAKNPKKNKNETTEIDELEEIKKMSIHEKLMNIKFELLDCEIKKSGHNQYGKFDYHELKDILPPVNRLCKKYRCLTHADFPDAEQVILTLINVDNPEDTISVHSPRPPLRELQRMNIIQSEGSYQTYMRKYSYMAMFDITEPDSIDALPTEEPPKNNNTNNNPNTTRKKTNSKPVKQVPKPPCYDSVVAKCHELYPDRECDRKLLNSVSFKMMKSNELTSQEREDFYNYLFPKS